MQERQNQGYNFKRFDNQYQLIFPPRNNQLEQPHFHNDIKDIIMASSIESEYLIASIEWCSPYSTMHFLDSYVVYQYHYLGLHANQMIKPALDPTVYVTMINFWILGYIGEQANYAQIKASTSTSPH